MNGYEIVLFIWLTLLTIGFSFTLIDMLDRTKNLNDTVTKLYSYVNVDVNPQIKRIYQLVNDEIINKKEDTSMNEIKIPNSKEDNIMNKEDFIQKVKVENLNTEIETGDDEADFEERAFARGWNACQREILNNIDKAFSNAESEG